MASILYVLTGPTGIGKTDLSIELAKQHKGEIISADSRQVYSGMDIGTGKPDFSRRNEVKHHLLDLFSPEEIVSAGIFADLAHKAMRDIWKRGNNAFMAGGSGLYIRATLKGIFEGPARDDLIRKKLEKEAERYGLGRLYTRLIKIDRRCAEKIHPHDMRRIVRALEVYMATGKKISERQKEAPWQDFSDKAQKGFQFIMACLYQDMKELYRKIDARVDEMLEKGFVGEVKGLVEKGFGKSFAINDTIGYKEILKYINGEISLPEAVELIKKNTRRFAKRQMTWFRSEKGIKWVEVREGEDKIELLSRVEHAFGLSRMIL